jgi:superfamily II DNA or RNA helicase
MANLKNILEGRWKEGRDFVPELLKAKEESDRKNYSVKNDILRRLIKESPREFLIDSEENGIYGITHRPSGFKIHLLKAVTPPELTRPQPKEQDKVARVAETSASEKATVLNRIMKKHSRGLKPDVKLQPHQQRVVDAAGPGIRKLLYHGLGSGKTLSAIAAAEKTQQPYGAVVPAALRPNFAKEQDKFTDKQLASDIQSYTMLARGKKPEHTGTVIMDEAHRLRNPDTEQTRVAKQLAEATDQLYLLSGSPIVNAPADLAPLMEMLTQETTTPEAFNEKYLKSTPVTPSLIDRWKGVTPGVVHDIKNKKKLHEALRGKVDYHEPAESPVAREEERIVVDMSPEQEQLHNEFYGTLPSSLRRKLDMQFPLSKSEQRSFLAFLSGPRQVALSTAPWQSEEDRAKTGLSQSPKLQRALFELETQIEEDPESRAVVFSNFIAAGLEPYAAALEDKKIPYGIFHGGLNDKQRTELVNKYNAGDLRVLLMGPSGGEGLSLEGTKLIQLLDPHWNETRLNQAIGRGIRYDSHKHLPEKDRKVKVQRFISQLPEKKQTGLFDILSILMGRGKPSRDAADAHLENYARDKQRLNDRFLAELKNIGTEKGSVSKQAAEEKWIGVDLDGTLAKYRGWKGVTHIGAPIPSMVSRVKRWLREGKVVKVFTARVAEDDGTARRAIENWCETHIGKVLPVTCVKDKNCVRIWDDRAVGVKSNRGRQVKLEYADKRAMVIKLAKARSKAQQRLFGIVHAAQKGEDGGSSKVQEMAKNISKEDVSDFAETKHKGLPNRKRNENKSKDKKASANVLGYRSGYLSCKP